MKPLQFLSTVILFTSLAFSQTQWTVDKSHTMVNFSVAHMVIAEVTGTFKEFDAKIESVKEDFTDAKLEVAIKAKSIDTGNNGRDRHLRSADFFNADVDSIITFAGTKFEKISEETYKIHGILTIRGISKEVVLDTKYKGKINARGKVNVAFKASTSINRKEWGLTWNRNIEAGGLLVGENVDLTIVAQFVEVKS